MMKRALVLGILVMSGVFSPAYAGETEARHRYMNQTCHHSTAAIFKQTLKTDLKDVNLFCECVSNTAVNTVEPSEDHAYALAYHEANIMVERSKRYNRPLSEITADFERRGLDYEKDYRVSIETLESHFLQAMKDVRQCSNDTPSAASSTLRGAFTGAFN